MHENRTVIVVGAGIVGLMAARELAPDHEVHVIDRGGIAGGATGKASGLVTVVEEYSDVPSAAEHAISFIRNYDGTGDFAFHERQYVELRSGDHDEDELRGHATMLRDRGYEEVMADAGITGHVDHVNSQGIVLFTDKEIGTYRDFLEHVDLEFHENFWFGMVNRGGIPHPHHASQQWTISVRHEEEHIEETIDAFNEIAPDLAERQSS